jgi:hypothetical protein
MTTRADTREASKGREPGAFLSFLNTAWGTVQDSADTGHIEAQGVLDVFGMLDVSASVWATQFDITWTTRAGDKEFRYGIGLLLDPSSVSDPTGKDAPYSRKLEPVRSGTSDPRTQLIFQAGVKTFRMWPLSGTVLVEQSANYLGHSISPDLLWLTKLERDNRATSDELIATINRLYIVLKARNFAQIDVIFRQLNLAKISPEMMLAFIRTTFAVRSKLREWCKFRERVRAELLSRHFDPDILLRGLG